MTQTETDISAQLEHPVLQQCFDYWRLLRGDRSMPSRKDIDPADIPAVLPFLALYDVVTEATRRYRFRLLGTRVVSYYGEDGTGQYLDEVLDKAISKILYTSFDKCCEDRQPAFEELTGLWSSMSRYRRLILPMSDNDNDVNIVMVCVVADFETTGSWTYAEVRGKKKARAARG